MLKSKIENKGPRTLYIQRKKSDVWHYHPSCPHFQRYENDPTAKHLEISDRPATGELCDNCKQKERLEREV